MAVALNDRRCPLCRPRTPEDLTPDSGVPASVKEQQVEFWVCARCGKVYWQESSCPADALLMAKL